MSIDKIIDFNRTNIEQFKENQTLKHIRNVNTELKTSDGYGNSGNFDSVDISSGVRELLSTLSNLKSELNKIGDVRKDKIEEVKARMESGYYDTSENIGKVASSLRNAAFRPLGT